MAHALKVNLNSKSTVGASKLVQSATSALALFLHRWMLSLGEAA